MDTSAGSRAHASRRASARRNRPRGGGPVVEPADHRVDCATHQGTQVGAGPSGPHAQADVVREHQLALTATRRAAAVFLDPARERLGLALDRLGHRVEEAARVDGAGAGGAGDLDRAPGEPLRISHSGGAEVFEISGPQELAQVGHDIHTEHVAAEHRRRRHVRGVHGSRLGSDTRGRRRHGRARRGRGLVSFVRHTSGQGDTCDGAGS